MNPTVSPLLGYIKSATMRACAQGERLSVKKRRSLGASSNAHAGAKVLVNSYPSLHRATPVVER